MKNYVYISYRNSNQNSESLIEITEDTQVSFTKDDKHKYIHIDNLTMKHRKGESICVIRYKQDVSSSTPRFDYGIIYVDECHARMFGGNYEMKEFNKNSVVTGNIFGHQTKMNYLLEE